MNEDKFSHWEHMLIRVAGLILLVIVIGKIIAAEIGVQLFP
jgi:hypothetical protein